MQMMYEVIAKELKSMQLEDLHPLDYLNFYCLGNREGVTKEMSEKASPTPANADAVIFNKKFIFCWFSLQCLLSFIAWVQV